MRSRNEDHGNISTYGLCGTICCCTVGTIGGGKVHAGARMLKPLSCIQLSWRRLTIHIKAAQVVVLCITMK